MARTKTTSDFYYQELKRDVRGTVKDSLGKPMPGVTVRVTNSTSGTSTDLNGKYYLDIPTGAKSLQFSLVGFKATEIVIGNQTEINVTLTESDSKLDEVVVVGFGTQKKITTVGAQASVNPEELKLPVRNLSASLLGRLSGLMGYQRGAEPGNDNGSIFIRGLATISPGFSTPLVLVDGVERELANIDPEDIESFNILKDASATAVYGVRGANGVILIVTKKGKIGKPKIGMRYSEGFSTFTKVPQLADGVTYMKMANEAITTRGGVASYSQDRIDNTIKGTDPYLYPNVDWVDEIFEDWTTNRNANLNISGGSPMSTYYVSAGYYKDNGILKTDALQKYNSKQFLERYNFTTNIQLNVTPTTLVELGIQGNIVNRNLPSLATAEIFSQVMNIPSVFHAAQYPDGKLAGGFTTALLNPYNTLTQNGYRTIWNNKIYSNIRANQKLDFWIPGLSFTTMFSFDGANDHSNNRTRNPDKWLASGRDADGNLLYTQTHIGSSYLGFSSNSSGSRQFYTESALNFNRSFYKSTVGALLLFNQRDLINTGGSLLTGLPFRSRGLAGRVNYSYDNRYMAEVNFGYNGSENFVPERRFGFFPSAGIGWVASEEPFFKPLKSVIQFLKLRATHGLVGSSDIDGTRFAYIGTIANTGGYSFGLGAANTSYSGLDIGEYPVDVSWETSTKTNIGMDVKTLHSKLNIQVDFFRESREGIFLRRTSLPAFLGIINEPYGNVGVVLNKGVDASMDYNARLGAVQLQFQGNFTYSKNKVIDRDEPAKAYPWMEAEGKKSTQSFGYTALGLFADSAEILASPKQIGDVRPGDVKFADLNGDGVIDQYDIGPIGHGSFPEIVYGFGLSAKYKAFSIGAFFQGTGNVDIILTGEGFIPFLAGSERGNLFSIVEDRWTPENPNPNAFYPRLTFGNINQNYSTSTKFLKDASYLRLKTLQLGYDLPKKWTQRAGIQNANIFLIGYNVLTFSKFDLWDVELGSGRGTNYPNMTTYSVGIDINF